MKKVLLINAHQFYEGFAEGKLNKTMVGVIKEEMEQKGCAVKLTYIEKGYDINEEVEKHIWADIIITQSPVYWFGTPWIYKKYIDEVFTTALVQQSLVVDDGRTRKDPNKQYGTGGKMQGKQYMLSLTWNAPSQAFGNKGQNLFEGKTVDDIFIGNTAAYKFCGAEILPSFSCYDVMKDPDVESDIERLKQHLISVC
ncbi:MAG: flavodoxin [Gammaproteobacteria bacterium (ex Lamellibrachia satsuma)]|nr:MAG: NAD(P)H-dependent oxidoreductase [Gammaproteobacteria bacterium (ex Lamellibrachia satsuma)]RRS33137.1 MAG: flavodoxin [Gammaproteobacteria bacterium (ex Lamellibrachia satsuma)]RRS36281.1 MAG: flavodoxin [Gammaproteobacteria bacterium (ex Lamellibrachia satsuma)]